MCEIIGVEIFEPLESDEKDFSFFNEVPENIVLGTRYVDRNVPVAVRMSEFSPLETRRCRTSEQRRKRNESFENMFHSHFS